MGHGRDSRRKTSISDLRGEVWWSGSLVNHKGVPVTTLALSTFRWVMGVTQESKPLFRIREGGFGGLGLWCVVRVFRSQLRF